MDKSADIGLTPGFEQYEKKRIQLTMPSPRRSIMDTLSPSSTTASPNRNSYHGGCCSGGGWTRYVVNVLKGRWRKGGKTASPKRKPSTKRKSKTKRKGSRGEDDEWEDTASMMARSSVSTTHANANRGGGFNLPSRLTSYGRNQRDQLLTVSGGGGHNYSSLRSAKSSFSLGRIDAEDAAARLKAAGVAGSQPKVPADKYGSLGRVGGYEYSPEGWVYEERKSLDQRRSEDARRRERRAKRREAREIRNQILQQQGYDSATAGGGSHSRKTSLNAASRKSAELRSSGGTYEPRSSTSQRRNESGSISRRPSERDKGVDRHDSSASHASRRLDREGTYRTNHSSRHSSRRSQRDRGRDTDRDWDTDFETESQGVRRARAERKESERERRVRKESERKYANEVYREAFRERMSMEREREKELREHRERSASQRRKERRAVEPPVDETEARREMKERERDEYRDIRELRERKERKLRKEREKRERKESGRRERKDSERRERKDSERRERKERERRERKESERRARDKERDRERKSLERSASERDKAAAREREREWRNLELKAEQQLLERRSFDRRRQDVLPGEEELRRADILPPDEDVLRELSELDAQRQANAKLKPPKPATRSKSASSSISQPTPKHLGITLGAEKPDLAALAFPISSLSSPTNITPLSPMSPRSPLSPASLVSQSSLSNRQPRGRRDISTVKFERRDIASVRYLYGEDDVSVRKRMNSVDIPREREGRTVDFER